MATKNVITVVFRDYMGQKSTVKLDGGTTMKDAKELANGLQKYTRAKILSVSQTSTVYYDGWKNLDLGDMFSGNATEHYDRVVQKAHLQFRDCDSGKMFTLSIPAPNDNVFGADQEVTAACAEDISDVIKKASTMEGMDLQYHGGWLTSKKPKVVKTQLAGN